MEAPARQRSLAAEARQRLHVALPSARGRQRAVIGRGKAGCDAATVAGSKPADDGENGDRETRAEREENYQYHHVRERVLKLIYM